MENKIPEDLLNYCLKQGKKLKMKPLEDMEEVEIEVEAQCVDKENNWR